MVYTSYKQVQTLPYSLLTGKLKYISSNDQNASINWGLYWNCWKQFMKIQQFCKSQENVERCMVKSQISLLFSYQYWFSWFCNQWETYVLLKLQLMKNESLMKPIAQVHKRFAAKDILKIQKLKNSVLHL